MGLPFNLYFLFSAQDRRHDLPLVHVALLFPDHLVILVPFAGKQYYITGRRLVNSPGDGGLPVADDLDGGGAVLHAGEDLVDDGLRILGAGIVAGDHAQIRQLRRDPAHDGALPVVPVAAAAEEGDESAPGDRAQGLQHLFQRVGLVGVVDEDRVVPVGGDHLHPALHALGAAHGVGAFLQRNPQRQAHRHNAQSVIDREHAGDGQLGQGQLPAHGGEAHTGCCEPQVLGHQVRLVALCRVGPAGAGGALEHKVCPGVVRVQAAHPALGKELALGGGVIRHVLVKVQVILAQVGVQPTSKRMPATRSRVREWEETSITTWVQPASAIRRKRLCSS